MYVLQVDNEVLLSVSKNDGTITLHQPEETSEELWASVVGQILQLFEFQLLKQQNGYAVSGKAFLRRFEEGLKVPPLGPQSKLRADKIRDVNWNQKVDFPPTLLLKGMQTN